jgi:hypothetical protein
MMLSCVWRHQCSIVRSCWTCEPASIAILENHVAVKVWLYVNTTRYAEAARESEQLCGELEGVVFYLSRFSRDD